MRANILPTTLALSLLAAAAGNPAAASPIELEDKYWGAYDWNRKDVIGEMADLDITKARLVSWSGNLLVLEIYTNFAGKAGMLFNNYTYNPEAPYKRNDPSTWKGDGKGLGYGDLFLAPVWEPYETNDPNGGSPHYIKDNHEKGTHWTYAVHLGNDLAFKPKSVEGTATLYELSGATNDDNAYLSDDYFGKNTGVIWRDGQVVAVDTVNNDSNVKALENTANFSVTLTPDSPTEAGFLRFEIDLTGTDLENAKQFAFHWGMTCANDVIEGEFSVPEPATLALLGLGLAGIGYGRRKRQ